MPKKITEDEHGFVTIDGQKIEGWIEEDTPCGICNGPRIYSDDYDAFFCPRCNLWLEEACKDPTCKNCRNRPERPLPRVKNVRTRQNIINALKHVHYAPIIIFFVGFIILVFCGVKITSLTNFYRNAESSYGIVLSERWVYGWPEVLAEERETRMVTVQFRTLDSGQWVNFEVGTDKLRLGEKVKVLYNPANPTQNEIEGWRGYSWWYFPIAVGIAFVIWGFLWYKVL